jgi:hypothetical protein
MLTMQPYSYEAMRIRVSNQAFDWLVWPSTHKHTSPSLMLWGHPVVWTQISKPLAHFWNPQLCGVSWGTRTQWKGVSFPWTIHASIEWWWCICGCWFTLATLNMYFLNNGKELSDHMINCNGNNIYYRISKDLLMRSTESGPEPAPITQCENYYKSITRENKTWQVLMLFKLSHGDGIVFYWWRFCLFVCYIEFKKINSARVSFIGWLANPAE